MELSGVETTTLTAPAIVTRPGSGKQIREETGHLRVTAYLQVDFTITSGSRQTVLLTRMKREQSQESGSPCRTDSEISLTREDTELYACTETSIALWFQSIPITW